MSAVWVAHELLQSEFMVQGAGDCTQVVQYGWEWEVASWIGKLWKHEIAIQHFAKFIKTSACRGHESW